jgi:hypothetical protein
MIIMIIITPSASTDDDYDSTALAADTYNWFFQKRK